MILALGARGPSSNQGQALEIHPRFGCKRSWVQIPDKPFQCIWKNYMSLCDISITYSISHIFSKATSSPISFFGVKMKVNTGLVGLGVWFSLRVREVPGSNPGRALSFSCKALRRTGVKCLIFQLAISGRDSSVGRALDWRSKGPRFDPGSRQFCQKKFEPKWMGGGKCRPRRDSNSRSPVY